MNLIICVPVPPLQSALAHSLIPQGFGLIKMNTLDEVFASIPARGNICLIDDGAVEKKDLIQKIVEVKKNEQKKSVRIMLITKSSDLQMISTYTKLGADLVLQSSLHFETIAEKIENFLHSISGQNAQRKHIRIKPDPKSEAGVKFLQPATNAYVVGKITDISMGGLAARFTLADTQIMQEKQVLGNVHISLDNKNIVADLFLVKKVGETVAFSFHKIRETFKDGLAEYIYFQTQKSFVTQPLETPPPQEEEKNEDSPAPPSS